MPGLTLRRRRFSPTGVDFKDSALYAVQMASSTGRDTLHAVNRADLPPPEDRAGRVQALREVVLAKPFRGRQVISSLPRGKTDIRPVRLPADADPADRREFLRGLATIAEGILPYDPREAILDYLPLGPTETNGRKCCLALLIAAPKADVDAHLALIQDAGLQCTNLDIAPCALARVLGAGEKRTTAVVEIDSTSTAIAIVRGTQVLFSRTLNWGRSTLAKRVAATLEMEVAQTEPLLRRCGLGTPGACAIEGAAITGLLDSASLSHVLYETCAGELRALADEIQSSLDYFVASSAEPLVEQIVLTGEMPFKGIHSALREIVSLPVELDGWSERSFIGPKSPHADSAFTVAAGLALRGER